MATVPASATTRSHHAPATHGKTAHRLSTHSRRHRHRIHGQQTIDSQRATQIQAALIREHYLTGEPSGEWDAATQAAMQKYQADHGWQTRLMPDSRALKALGLGPDYSTAINAREVAASNAGTAPAPAPGSLSATPAAQTAGFTAASGVNR